MGICFPKENVKRLNPTVESNGVIQKTVIQINDKKIELGSSQQPNDNKNNYSRNSSHTSNASEDELLNKINPSDITLEEEKYHGTVVRCILYKVYDGDTCSILFIKNGAPIAYRMRLYGIDCPEMKPLKSIANREAMIEKAKESKAFLIQIAEDPNNKLIAHIIKNEKFGRKLVRIYVLNSDETNIYTTPQSLRDIEKKALDTIMVQKGLGVPYFGGKKE